MERFAQRYGETWEAWDAPGFLALFHDEIVYVAHPDEVVRGLAELARYFQKEQDTQGAVRVRMGRPFVQKTRVIAEFWTTSVGQDRPWSCPGCLIADFDPVDGRCRRFREYWFELEGEHEPFPGWGA
jgi:SnoaL-like domain